MASSPFHLSVPGPPPSARPQATLEWGASVHGSSACLQAMNQGYLSPCGAEANPPQPHQTNAWHGTAQTGYPPPYQGNVGFSSYGSSGHHSGDYTRSHMIHEASSHYPQHPGWQQAERSSSQYTRCDAGAQHEQHYNAHQYAWQSYQCHSAVQDPAAAALNGENCDGWEGWALYSGARLNPLTEASPVAATSSVSGAYPNPHPPPSQQFTQGYGQARPQEHLQDTKQQQQQSAYGEGRCTTSTPEAAGKADAAIAIDDEQYDPLSDVEALAGVVRAATVLDNVPKGQTEVPGAGKDKATTAQASTPISEPAGRADNCGGGGSVHTMTASASLTSAMPAAAASAPAATVEATVPAVSAVDLIVVWDLDETLIIFNSLLSGAFALATTMKAGRGPADSAAAAVAAVKVAPSTAPESGLSNQAAALGNRLAEMVFNFCDDHMAFKMMDSIDPVSFLELWSLTSEETATESVAVKGGDGNGGGSGRRVDRVHLERIAEIYAGGAAGLSEVIGDAGCHTRAATMAEAEDLTGAWVTAARQLLTGVRAAAAATAAATQQKANERPVLAFRSVRHVLVSAGHLVATLGKLVLWGLDEHFDIRDVYSASGRSKLEIFRSLRLRFGPTVAYAAVGDGVEEERAAVVMGWGFVRVGLASTAAATASTPTYYAHPQGRGAAEPWRMPRPIRDIRPEDVLEAARRAY